MEVRDVTQKQVPKSVIGFLRDHVDHIEKLRLVLALHRAVGGTLSVQNAARELDIPKSQIRDMANELAQDGLVRISVDQLELAPTSIEDRLAIADLADWYAHERKSVLDVLRAWGRAS
jgi:DNA-binding IclR family transcriptional regulator